MKPKDSNGFIQHQSANKCYLCTISAHHLELVYSSFGVRYGSRYHTDRRCEILTPLWGLCRVRVHVEVVSGPDVFDLWIQNQKNTLNTHTIRGSTLNLSTHTLENKEKGKACLYSSSPKAWTILYIYILPVKSLE